MYSKTFRRLKHKELLTTNLVREDGAELLNTFYRTSRNFKLFDREHIYLSKNYKRNS